jgi:hypothetical protein
MSMKRINTAFRAQHFERVMAELIWEGKYDKDGKKTAPVWVA